MKFRFSILSLLAFTAYVALNVVAFSQPLTFWPWIAFGVAALLLLIAIVVASGKASARAAFSRGFVLAILAYRTVNAWEPPGNGYFGYLGYAIDYYLEQSLSETDQLVVDANSWRGTLLDMNVQLAVGVLVGLGAAWCYRRRERQEKVLH